MNELKYTFPCGCSFTQKNDTIKDYDGLPPLEIDYYNIPLTCQGTWDLLSSGRTRGVSQLGSNFAKSTSKELKPDNIDHISALIAILRPGASQSEDENGKSMTKKFIDRRHGKEPVTYIDERLEKYLSTTFGILVYQEQMMAISRGMAGFSAQDSYKLLKGAAKKDAKILFSFREQFITGCINNGVPEDIAGKIFDNMEASARYNFNSGHSYSYSYLTYATAYAKYHFPLHFFCSYLKRVKNSDELKELMSELTLFDLSVKTPSIDNLTNKFNIRDGYIQYGLGEVKEVGKDATLLIEKIIEVEKTLNKPATEFTWYEFLILISPFVCKTAINNLILCGFLNNIGVSRNEQLHEYNTLLQLKTQKVKMKWIAENYSKYTNLEQLLDGLLSVSRECDKPKIKSLIASLKNPGRSLDDTNQFLYRTEKELLGVSITANLTKDKERLANITCVNFLNGKGFSNLIFVVLVSLVDEKIIKTGKNAGKRMANIKLSDRTGEIECTIFSKEWAELKSLIVEGNVLAVHGKRHQDGSLKIENVQLL